MSWYEDDTNVMMNEWDNKEAKFRVRHRRKDLVRF